MGPLYAWCDGRFVFEGLDWVGKGFRFGCWRKARALAGRSLARLKSGHYNGEEKGGSARGASLARLKSGPTTAEVWAYLAAYHFLQFFGVAGALHWDLGGGGVQFAEIS